MPTNISGQAGNYAFEGPYANTGAIRDISGVYVIVCETPLQNVILDVGESGTLKSRIDYHDRSQCWKRNCQYALKAFILYAPEQQRIRIESDIRARWNLPCGER